MPEIRLRLTQAGRSFEESMRVKAKRDGPEAEIIQALEAFGVRVQILSDPGVPDLLVWTPRTGMQLLEVKSRFGRLTRKQQAFTKMPYTVIRSVEEALRLFQGGR